MSDALHDRYAAVERLYSQGQWDAVMEASSALLGELPVQPGDPLRQRLQLLQGHTQLYGLGQIANAAAIYQQVLADQPEAMLQSIAQQELNRCQEALAATPAAATETFGQTEIQPTLAEPAAPEPSVVAPSQAATPLSQEFPFTAQPMGAAPAGQAASAMPWLEALGGVDPGAAPETTQAAAAPWEAAPFTPAEAEPAATSRSAPQAAPPEPAAESEASEPDPVPALARVTEPTEVDVIEEPEQIEVQQADPKRAEAIDLEPVQPASRWSSAEEAELAKGLLTVVLR